MAKKPKLRAQTHAYWQKRSVERTLEAERQMLPYLRRSRQVYAKSAREVTKQVQDIYAKYYRDNGFDVQALRQLPPQGDVRRLKARMRKLGLETKLPDNYAFRVNRLEMLNLQMRAEAYDVGRQIKVLTGKTLSNTYQTSYYRTVYDTAKGIGYTPAFSQLNTKTVNKVLNSKNYGKNFSERIWGRSQKLGDELQSIIGTAIATGQSPAKTARLLRERFNVSISSAERLIRTETNYYENQAELDAYKEMGVEEYQFIATIDTWTSEICQHLDHKVFKVKDARVGVNVPPCHPNCRSTVAPYFGKEWEPEARIARDPETGRNQYVTNMSYNEWLGKIADGTISTFKSEKKAEKAVISVVTTPATVYSTNPHHVTERVHKGYIGDRSHLLPLIQNLWTEKDPMSQGFAKILSGIKKKVTISGVAKNSRKTLLDLAKIDAKIGLMRIRLSRKYLLHMDNSGHFTGFGYGKYGHDDKNPLSIADIKNITRIINSANKGNTLFKEIKRGVPRLSIIGKTDNNQMVLVEIDRNGNFVDVVTSYKLTKRQWLKMQIEIKRQNTAL